MMISVIPHEKQWVEATQYQSEMGKLGLRDWVGATSRFATSNSDYGIAYYLEYLGTAVLRGWSFVAQIILYVSM